MSGDSRMSLRDRMSRCDVRSSAPGSSGGVAAAIGRFGRRHRRTGGRAQSAEYVRSPRCLLQAPTYLAGPHRRHRPGDRGRAGSALSGRRDADVLCAGALAPQRLTGHSALSLGPADSAVMTADAVRGTEAEWLTPGVKGIGTASFLADAGHEVPTALLPSLLTSTLSASPAALGVISERLARASSHNRLRRGHRRPTRRRR